MSERPPDLPPCTDVPTATVNDLHAYLMDVEVLLAALSDPGFLQGENRDTLIAKLAMQYHRELYPLCTQLETVKERSNADASELSA